MLRASEVRSASGCCLMTWQTWQGKSLMRETVGDFQEPGTNPSKRCGVAGLGRWTERFQMQGQGVCRFIVIGGS